jgi:hypothetical protein
MGKICELWIMEQGTNLPAGRQGSKEQGHKVGVFTLFYIFY